MTSQPPLASHAQRDHEADFARDTAPSSQWWDRTQFFGGAEANVGKCPEVIDLTGRACFLFYGPYVPLTAGLWRATVTLTICADAARRPLALQFGAEPDYVTADLPFGVSGDHRLVLEHRFDGAQTAQVRLWLKKAAFHGQIRFLGACVEPVEDRSKEEPAAWRRDDV